MLRNKEIRHFFMLLAVLAVLSTAAGCAIHPLAGLLALGTACAFAAAFFFFTKARYRRLARLADEIDMVLHHEDHVFISELDEGELSILHDEITKMTVRLREQNDALRREKQYLADSLADIAHQLRTPLTSINLLLTLLEDAGDEGQRRAFVRETADLLSRMDWLITSLLKMSRLDASIITFRQEQVDVSGLFRDVLRPFLIAMDLHDVSLQIDIPAGLTISGDPVWLAEALRNILKNCMESMGDHGTLEISCMDNPLYTQLSIHDSGPGFSPEDLPHVFDRFYRGKEENASGYGIGLALCRTVIARQGGAVTARNHPQGGALFSIRFPK